MSKIITLKNVEKIYGDTVALSNINLQFEEGKVYGLIGRNGAGKTTLLKIIAGQLNLTKGEVIVNEDLVSSYNDIVLAKDHNHYYQNVKLKEILYIARNTMENWDNELEKELLEQFELNTKKYYMKSSKGMQTMVALIIGLCSNAKVLMLDEPYAGLDPINRETFYRILRTKYFTENKTVIISSHLIKEIQGYFENAIILNQGKVLVDDTVENIREKSFVIECNKEKLEAISKRYKVLNSEKIGNHMRIYIFDEILEKDQRALEKDGGKIHTMDLQDVMVQMCMRREK